MKYPARLGHRLNHPGIDGVPLGYRVDVLTGIPEAGNGSLRIHIWYQGKEHFFSSDGWGMDVSRIVHGSHVQVDENDAIAGTDLCLADLLNAAMFDYAKIISNIDTADKYMALEPDSNGNLWRMEWGALTNG